MPEAMTNRRKVSERARLNSLVRDQALVTVLRRFRGFWGEVEVFRLRHLDRLTIIHQDKNCPDRLILRGQYSRQQIEDQLSHADFELQIFRGLHHPDLPFEVGPAFKGEF